MTNTMNEFQVYKKLKEADVRFSEYVLLHFLKDGPVKQADLPGLMGISGPMISRHMLTMTIKGLIDRAIDSTSPRNRIVKITDKGLKLIS